MAPHLNQKRSIKSTLLSIVAIMIGAVACTGSIVVALDLRCRADIDHWMPVYPNAEIQTVQQSGFFRLRASGISQIIYVTDDDPATVRNWYTAYRREITANIRNENNPERAARGLATTRNQISDNPDGTGSRITQTSECAYN
ncbi:MAG: hypothetical protein Q9P01_22300 [Anaerolineae bacterium]|nr:hypothetical protein [Anaerolineae bacterium]MDQ7037470.1 hypothetical protein [Anaerolineae bacterium]